MFTPLLFALALGVLGILFRMWVARRGLDPTLALGAVGLALMGFAFLTVVYAMHTACHGDYDILQSVFACTRLPHR